MMTFFGCTHNNNERIEEDSNDKGVIKKDTVFEMPINKEKTKELECSDSLDIKYKFDIQGIWGVSKEENSDFFVHEDSITYTEHLGTSYYYTITCGNLTIYFEDGNDKYTISEISDSTMVLKDEYGEEFWFLKLGKKT